MPGKADQRDYPLLAANPRCAQSSRPGMGSKRRPGFDGQDVRQIDIEKAGQIGGQLIGDFTAASIRRGHLRQR